MATCKPGDVQKDKFFAEKTEKLLARAGAFGYYQIAYMTAIQFLAWQYCGNFIFMSFSGLPTPFLCPETNLSATSDSYAAVCEVISRCDTNYTLQKPYEFRTVIHEFPSLVTRTCVDNTSTSFISSERTIITATMVSAGLAIIPAGILSDLLGRKTLLVLGSTGATFLGILAGVVESYVTLVVLYVVAVIFVVMCSVPALSLCSEYTLTKYRILMNFACTWCVAYIAAAGVAYLTKDWRKYLIVWNLAALPLIAAFMSFDESPRWLLLKEQYGSATRCLNKMAFINWRKDRFTEEEIEMILAGVKKEKRSCVKDLIAILYGVSRIFTHKKLSMVTLTMLFYQFAAALLGMLFQFNLDRFFTVPYVSLP